MLRRIFSQFRTPKRPPLVVIVGPTASGKSAMAITLAGMLYSQGQDAEIVSADSRQIYKEIPIFSAAVTPTDQSGIPHYFVGSESVQDTHTAGWFAREATRCINAIHARGAIPIVAGGSGFWVQGLICNQAYPEVPPNPALRAELAEYSLAELGERLQRVDAHRAESIDLHNPRRVVRAIEIAEALGEVPERTQELVEEWDIHLVYLAYPVEDTRTRIAEGVRARYRRGLVQEAEEVYRAVGPHRFNELGLAYKYCEAYWRGEIDKDELIEKTIIQEQRYAKRQRLFFNKMIQEMRGAHVQTVTDVDARKDTCTLLARTLDRYRSTLHSYRKTEA